MILYRNSTNNFKKDVLNNRLADLMSETFKNEYGRKVSKSEYNSWQNSCQYVKNLITQADLKDSYILLEYEIPYNTSRLDCMLFGKSIEGKKYSVLIELKQWSEVDALDDEDNFVETFTGGGKRKVPHPSQQVEGYHNHLINFVQIYELDKNFDLYSCVYCHNYSKKENEGLFSNQYSNIIEKYPVYTKNDFFALADKLKNLLSAGNGFEIFNRFMQSPIKPSKKLLENVSKIVDNNKVVFSLLNEQLVAKNIIISKIKKFNKVKNKSVVIVHGGPGTGKTVIAINILAELAKLRKSVFYGCKSKPFREALTKLVGKDSKILFSNLTRFLPSRTKENEFDVILIDEAHRIQKSSNSQYTKKQDRTDMPQIEQLIRCAKTSVFFIDDKQNVRSQEIGSSELIKQYSKKYNADCEFIELKSQFRCAGSDSYLDWLDFIFDYSNKKIKFNHNDNFKFRIVDNPNSLYKIIKNHENSKKNSARIVAGYCWPWSKDLNPDGTLKKDVVIPEFNFEMPWEAQDKYSSKLQKGIPKWYQWAYKTEGVEQIGCIYTSQGFEFDYIGVIVGPDLKLNKETDKLYADIDETKDPTLKRYKDNFEMHVKNIYRVLMTRGLKGCYVYFCDKEVENFFIRNIEGNVLIQDNLFTKAKKENINKINIIDDVANHKKFTEYLPVHSLKAVATSFGKEEYIEVLGWIKTKINRNLNKNMFIAKVIGKSMEPTIKDGSWCVFQFDKGGSRNNKIVLVESRKVTDPESNGAYTIKRYHSKKEYFDDGTWRHKQIILSPDNKSFNDIILDDLCEDDYKVIAEYICTL